jgi:glycosyltransferase involved in cell wall biosynthesis
LAQTVQPLEVLICDDGSTDGTQARFESWAARDQNVQYLRLPSNSGTPALTRNLGLKHARGAWIAFLDDDDTWYSTKLETQARWFQSADLVAANALRSNGQLYFPDAPPVFWPTPNDILHANPFVISSVVARRDLVASTGGFICDRWARGVADYAMWLALADRSARAVVLGEPLVCYTDAPGDRMSDERTRSQLAVGRLMWNRARSSPSPRHIRAALRHGSITAVVAAHDLLGAWRNKQMGYRNAP